MKKGRLLLVLILLTASTFGQKQNKAYLEYIEQYKDIAIREMNEYRIPASITLAQGVLESGAGKGALAVEANNHFGIKCQKNWEGERVYHDDDAKGECFRKYPTALESYEDHSKFLVNGQRYASLFELPSNDYKGWATGLKKAGYATEPTYANRLIKIIDDYGLSQYDRVVVKGEHKCAPAAVSVDGKSKAEPVLPPVTKKRSFWDKLFHRNEAVKVESVNSVKPLAPSDVCIAEISAFRTHTLTKINGVKCVIAMPGDTYESIADELEMYEKELLKANEVQYGANPKAGEIVFLAKKKSKGLDPTYTVQEGETVYQISQKVGMRVRALYRLNGIVYGKQVSVGDVLKLR